MKYKAVIFDLDGTLINTLEDIGNSVNRVLVRMGFPPHPLEKYREFVGDGSRMLVTRALGEGQRDEKRIMECLEGFFEDYSRNWRDLTRPYEGIPELLDGLAARGIKMAVLSNKRHDLTQKCVNYFFPGGRFDAIFGQRDSVPRKPHPAGALEIADILMLPPKKFLYAGDSGTDMETALAAQMFSLGVLWGFRTQEELMEKGAEAVIDHPLRLLDLLEN
jgi:phosphoglycolate phosphatase